MAKRRIVSVKINTRLKDFIHCWPEAPEEVSFLRNPHRHELHISVEVSVNHDDRDIEFFMLKRAVDKFLDEAKGDWPLRISCEEIGHQLVDFVISKYGKRDFIEAQVFEDGEVGSTVTATR